jgi:hypothetical protein
MAGRESQGLQIALIIFVMVTVVLAVLTFVFYRSAEQRKKELAAAKEQKQAADQNFNLENFKVQYLKHILGAAPLDEAGFNEVKTAVVTDEEMSSINDLYEQHMATYGEPYQSGETITNYRDLLPNLAMALRERNVANSQLTEQVNQLNAENQQLQQDEKQRTEEAVANLQKARNDLAKRMQDFQKNRDDLATQQQSQLSTFKQALVKEQTRVTDAQKSEAERQGEMKKMQVVIDQQRQALQLFDTEEFETPDGKVLWVNQRTQTAWIDLGSADGLRRQTLFSVFGQEATGVTDAERKASIEVVKVINEGLAEARIVYDDPANPILPGDVVFSPAWRPGRRVHFALAGLLDIDGDGKSDRDLVRNLITASGAVIDADVTERGASEGAITSTTRYMVKGGPPLDLKDPKAVAAWNKINQDARQLGVQIITLDQLLDQMGYKAEVRTVPLGRGARSEDFGVSPAQGRARTSTGNVADVFEERSPPVAPSGSGSPF